MDYQGRSPLKDITRSVIMGAAMIPAAVLAGCSRNARPQGNDPNSTGGSDNTVTMTPGDAGTNAIVQAPPPDVVRPRTPPVDPNANNNVRQMPTRGFAGAVRVRG
jgi:hypothetical protein